MTTRWSKDDPKQGSAFHELIVLPTVAPELARPYHTPGTEEFFAAQAAREAAESAANELTADVAPESSSIPAEPVDPALSHEFFALITLEWAERPGVKPTRSTRLKKVSESKNSTDPIKVLGLNRSQFITASLAAHGYQNSYTPGPSSGPGFQISWAGYPQGGKSKTPVIQDDADWAMIQSLLRAALDRSKSKLNAISVSFDLDTMLPFCNRKRPLSVERDHETHVELQHGSYVPSIATFSADQVAKGQAIDKIKAAWPCEEHGTCFINKDGVHIELNRFQLGAFADAVLANQCHTDGPPPSVLLQSWTNQGSGAASAASRVPRGRSGPGLSHIANEGSSSAESMSTNGLLLSTVVPMIAVMAKQTMDSFNQSHSRRHAATPPPPSSPLPLSSPPPMLSSELDAFFQAFSREKGISSERISVVSEQLSAVHYSPDSVSEADTSRLQELTGLHEGEVLTLHCFARSWCGKVEMKRRKLRK